MIRDEIRKELFALQDIKYRDFQMKLIPGKDPENSIGVRTPELRRFAKELSKRPDIGEFLNDLPHEYFDEDQLHAFIISGIRDYDSCMDHVERFLPYVDNWATCDQMSPKVFKKHKPALAVRADKWLDSDRTYTIRFGIKMLMEHFLGEEFSLKYPERVSDLRSDEYYVNMMIAWYFATALAKQYDAILPFIENKRLDVWTHNKAIQKAVESYRITPEQKEYLKTLKRKK
jgi:3-methyladenine DNA glycosylase AlkD